MHKTFALKRTPLLLTLLVFALAVGGYYIYERVLLREPLEPFDLVPQGALFVYEKDICESCIEQFRGTHLWEIIKRAAVYDKPADSLGARLEALLDNTKQLLVSAHVTRKDDFDFVYYLDAPSPKELSEKLTSLSKYRYTQRQYNDVVIQEVSSGKTTFSWAILENVMVASFTPFLIEDIIRTRHGKPGFTVVQPQAKRLPRISGDAGNVYVHLENLQEWISLFGPHLGRTRTVGGTSLLDIRTTDNTVILNGFSTAGAPGHLLTLFARQTPVELSLKNRIPNRTVVLTTFGISDGARFSDALSAFVARHRPAHYDSLDRLSSGLPSDRQALLATISDEVALCEVESLTGQRLARILMVETSSPDKWLGYLNALSEKTSEDTVFHEPFSQYTIREMPVSNFTGKLLWPLVEGFKQTYYCADDEVVYFSDNLEELKRFLEDLELEDTWGKSVSRNQFLDGTLLESSISVYLNVPRVWNLLIPHLNPRWKKFVNDNPSLLRSVDMSAFQFSHLNNTFYTNVTFRESEGTPDVAFASAGRRSVVHLPNPLQRVHVVKSHVSPANEILIQDSLNDLRLVSMEGKVLWTLPIGDQITSDIDQIDYYNNGKLQYIFSTRDALHIIDRLGNYVSSFPLHLKGKNIKHLAVVDYDRSKRYRFLITEEDGKLSMYDKMGKNLEGWTPLEVGGPLFAPARHHRIRARDFIVAIRRDGKAFVYNRRGELAKGFPIDLQGTPMGDYVLEMGQGVADSWFVVVTRDGYRVRFNAEGKILHRESLLRAYVGSQFSLIPEKSHKSYLVVQHDRRQLTVSDANGRRIISNNYIDIGDGGVQYYQFSGGRRFICLTDRVQQMSYVFNDAGDLLTSPPLESVGMALSPPLSDASHVFYIHGNRLTIQSLTP